jgi:hypothetical protein
MEWQHVDSGVHPLGTPIIRDNQLKVGIISAAHERPYGGFQQVHSPASYE